MRSRSHDAPRGEPLLCDVPGRCAAGTAPRSGEVIALQVAIFAGALGTALVTIVGTAAPQWRRIVDLVGAGFKYR